MKKKLKNAFENRATKKAKTEITGREIRVINLIGFRFYPNPYGSPVLHTESAESISRFLGDKDMSSYIKTHRTKGEGDEKQRYRCSATGKRVIKSLLKKGLIQMNMWRIKLTDKGKKYVVVTE